MDFALFQTPFLRPERTPREVFDWAVTQAAEADRAGFTEYWVGEHYTLNWESIPSPELVIAAAARETETIKLCPGAHLLPYHHPATLAIQVSWLSHVTEGRYILGVGAGTYPSDAALHGLKDLSQNHRMVLESLSIMQKIWKGEPFQMDGEYWKAGFPEPPGGGLDSFGEASWRKVTPYGGEIELALAGVSADSPSIKFAGTHGYLPLSIFAGDPLIANHWDVYSAAASEAGRVVDRSRHHVAREVLVAETDAEARSLAINGGMGQAWMEYLLPAYKAHGLLDRLITDPDVNPLDVEVDYLADHVWIVGSPDTVVEKLEESFAASGGWGTTLIMGHDYIDAPEAWNQSMSLLATEVGPRVKLPTPAAAA